MEQCLITLTQIFNIQTAGKNWQTAVKRQIKYIQPFTGQQRTLPSFIAKIDQLLSEYQGQCAQQVFHINYNKTITGEANNYLASETPDTWTKCKEQLKYSSDQRRIIQPLQETSVILRSQSFRQGPLNACSRSQSHSYVNSSISANPLLPIDTAEWDSHNQCNTSKKFSLTKREPDASGHPEDNLTELKHSLVTAAQVEIYQARSYVQELPNLEVKQPHHLKVGMDQLNSNRSVSPQGQAHPEEQHLSPNHLFRLYNGNSPRQALVDSQACASVQQTLINHKFNQSEVLLVDHNSFMQSDMEKLKTDFFEEVVDSNLTTSTNNRESVVHPLDRSQHSTPVHYSSTSCSMSKGSHLNKNNSTETETDNIIYTDINDIFHYKYPNEYASKLEHKISNENNLNLAKESDIYATVNRKSKSKIRETHFSDKFVDESIIRYTVLNTNPFNTSYENTIQNDLTNNSLTVSNFCNTYPNNLNLSSDPSTDCAELKHDPIGSDHKTITQSDHSSLSLPRNLELNEKMLFDLYTCNYVENFTNLPFKPNSNELFNHTEIINPSLETCTIPVSNRPQNLHEKHKKPDKSLSNIVQHKEPCDDDNTFFQIENESWLRSSSCKDLFIEFSYVEGEKSKPMTNFEKVPFSFSRIDSPITRYDDFCHSMYITKNQSIAAFQDISVLTHSKVFSSSYPGSICNTLEYKKRNFVNQVDFTGSQEDISHDSYELLEKFDTRFFDDYERDNNIRSCSMDSGNYIQSDDESDAEFQKYRSAMDVKCKSVANIMNEIWDSEDPRYLPREKLSVKSDGSFYKKVKEALGSKSSSQESRNGVFETKVSRSSDCSKKSKDSLYHTDSKKSRETNKSKTSLGSSQDSRESLSTPLFSRNYEMPMTTGQIVKKDFQKNQYEKHSSLESKSDYYDAVDSINSESIGDRPKVKSFGCLLSDTKNSSLNSSFYDNRDTYSTFPTNKNNKTSKVHSISLQNVEIERNTKSFGNTSPEKLSLLNCSEQKTPKFFFKNNPHDLKNSEKQCEKIVEFRRRSDSENIFSFDQEKIESLTCCGKQSETFVKECKSKSSPEYPLTPELISEYEKRPQTEITKKTNRIEELIAKTHFEEYNPKMIKDVRAQLPGTLVPFTYCHAVVERTKSDPNSLANRSKLGSNSRRHVLIHQKSIDLTPADSSDEDYFYKQIPSAPPVCKAHGNFDISRIFNMSQPEKNIPKSGFEMPNGVLNEYECRASTVREDIPYVLHKRHVMNGTAPPVPSEKKYQKTKNLKSPKSPKSPKSSKNINKKNETTSYVQDIEFPAQEEFLFPQKEDRSINSLTVIVEKTIPKIELSSPKRNISSQIDIKLMEKLNKKLGEIENDSVSNSRTGITQKEVHNNGPELKKDFIQNFKKGMIIPSSIEVVKQKAVAKTRSANKHKQGKTRITSFSSDDESLDSDDVFGSTEAIPLHLEFSPPQSRKEIEPILRIEQSKLISAAWGRGQTMSSTEIEGSPPQCRRLAELESRYNTQRLDSPYSNPTELRRISERSISIPSSEEENVQADTYTMNYQNNKNEPQNSKSVKGRIYSKNVEIKILDSDVNYTLKKNNSPSSTKPHPIKSELKLTEEHAYVDQRSKDLFAHTRLNLSEGSAIASLQNQNTFMKLPTVGRRTKSLDTPIISMHKLPLMNAFSSKDDTMEIEEKIEIFEKKTLQIEVKNDTHGFIASKRIYNSQGNDLLTRTVTIDSEENNLLNQLNFIEKIALQGINLKNKKKSNTELENVENFVLEIPKYKFNCSPYSSGNSSRKTSPGVSRTSSIESNGKSKPKFRSKSPETGKSKFGLSDIDNTKKERKIVSKERSKLSDQERSLSKEKNKSQEESEADIAKRKEKQQKLYESAMQHTITMYSPEKDQNPKLSAFQDKISVKTSGESIIIETQFNRKVKDHVLIAKSPRNLDTSLVNFSRSFDEGRSQEKIEKVNRSFEDRKKSFEEPERSETGSDIIINSQKDKVKIQKLRKLEESLLNNKFDVKPTNFEIDSDVPVLDTVNGIKKESHSIKIEHLNKSEVHTGNVKKGICDQRMFSNPQHLNEEIDMQAVISERRTLDLLQRQSLPSEDTNRDSDGSRKPSTADSIDSFVSIDETNSDSKPTGGIENYLIRLPTIECEEPSIEDNDEISSECRNVKISRFNINCLSFDRSRSDETGSWMTVECEEYIGSDPSDNEFRTQEPERNTFEAQATLDDVCDLTATDPLCTVSNIDLSTLVPNSGILPNKSCLDTTEIPTESSNHEKNRKVILFQQNDKSKSSDSWTSGEGPVNSPKREREILEWSMVINGKDKISVDETESSVSCSIARPLGISQDFEDIEEKQCLDLRKQLLESDFKVNNQKHLLYKKIKGNSVKDVMHVLEKQCPIDLSVCNLKSLNDQKTPIVIEDDYHSITNCSTEISKIMKIDKVHSQKPCACVQKFEKTGSDRSSQESKSSFDSKGSLSIESRGSFETESSSGSLGIAQRRGDLFQKEQQLTWKPFTIESSGSSSLDEPWHNSEQESFEQTENLQIIDSSEYDYKEISSEDQKECDTSFQDDLNDFPTTFGYPAVTSSLCGIGASPTDIMGYSTGFTIGRTLSRISERSTTSEKSSVEDDISKASTHSVSIRDESVGSTDHQPSLSSDSRSNTNIAYISDADRRTSAEMPEIPCDSATGDRVSSICSFNEPRSPAVVTGRFSVTQVDEKPADDFDRQTLLCLSNPGSQDSEDWPLPEIPFDHVPIKPSEMLYSICDQDQNGSKTFSWNSCAFQQIPAQDFTFPKNSLVEKSSLENVEMYYTSESQNPKENILECTSEETDIISPEGKNQIEANKEVCETVKVLPYTEATYFMPLQLSLKNEKEYFCMPKVKKTPPTCLSSMCFLSSPLFNSSCYSKSKNNKTKIDLLKENVPESIIILQPSTSPQNRSPISEEESTSNDDVFMAGTVRIQTSPDESGAANISRKYSRGSNNSDTSIDDIISTSGVTYVDDQIIALRKHDKCISAIAYKKCSHSSHSEEETSSVGTDLDGTVRMGLQQNKCTHSSHSEDTSIGLSMSEWSTGTNTVRQYANLSGSDSLSAVSNHSFGAKSEKSNLTKSSLSSINKSCESLNEKSTTFSNSKNKISIQNCSSDGFLYDILSNSETDKFTDSLTRSDDTTITLTDMGQTLSEWSTSNSRTSAIGQAEIQQMTNIKYHQEKSIEYVPLTHHRIIRNSSPPNEKNSSLSLVNKKISLNGNYCNHKDENIRSKSTKKFNTMDSLQYTSTKIMPAEVTKKRHSLELMAELYQSQDFCSEGDVFVESLYDSNEKLTPRYQSQEFVPLQMTNPVATTSKQLSESYPTTQHFFEDKTSKSLRKHFNKFGKLRHSHSFHDHFYSSNQIVASIKEENFPSDAKEPVESYPVEAEVPWSTENPNPWSIVRSDFHPNQAVQKSSRKVLRSKFFDSLMNFRTEDLTDINHDCRIKRLIQTKPERSESADIKRDDTCCCKRYLQKNYLERSMSDSNLFSKFVDNQPLLKYRFGKIIAFGMSSDNLDIIGLSNHYKFINKSENSHLAENDYRARQVLCQESIDKTHQIEQNSLN